MRSTKQDSVGSPTRDARAEATASRIRAAAIERFGRSGFSVSLRTIAADAGVSAGLIVHHFGSRDGLEKACDDLVAATIHDQKMIAANARDAGTILNQLMTLDEYAPQSVYLLRRLQAGGPHARDFMNSLIDDSYDYIETGVHNGTIRPSRDPWARAKYLALTTIGGLVLQLTLHGNLDDPDLNPPDTLRSLAHLSVGPALELYSEPFFTDRALLDTFVAHEDEVPWPDGTSARPDPPPTDNHAQGQQ